MRDGSTRRRTTSPQPTTWTPERVQVAALATTRTASTTFGRWPTAHAASRWTRGLLNALLEELHVSDDFDRARRPASPACPPASTHGCSPSRCSCDTAGRSTTSLAPVTRLGLSVGASWKQSSTPTAATAVHRRRGNDAGAAPRATSALKGVSHVERIVLDLSIHTRSPRAGTRLRLPSAARQRRTRRRRAHRGAEQTHALRPRSSRR